MEIKELKKSDYHPRPAIPPSPEVNFSIAFHDALSYSPHPDALKKNRIMLHNPLTELNPDVEDNDEYYSQLMPEEAAVLSLDSYYEENDSNRPKLPENWVRLMDSGLCVDGYYGVIYIKYLFVGVPRSSIGIVCAHRGSNFIGLETASDLVADLNIIQQQVPSLQISSAENFLKNKAFPELKKRFRNKRNFEVEFIVQTGHSLGAIISDLCAMGQFSITFENPGSKEIWKKYYRQKLIESGKTSEAEIDSCIMKKLEIMQKKCIVFLGDLNIINACNEQLSHYPYRCVDLPYNYITTPAREPMDDIPINVFLNSYYIWDYGFKEQHGLEGILKYLKNYSELSKVHNPVGFHNGYTAYLDPNRRKYWNGYFKYIWEHTPELQEHYQEFYLYLSDAMDSLKVIYESSKKLNSLDKNATGKLSDLSIFKKDNQHIPAHGFTLIDSNDLNVEGQKPGKRFLVM